MVYFSSSQKDDKFIIEFHKSFFDKFEFVALNIALIPLFGIIAGLLFVFSGNTNLILIGIVLILLSGYLLLRILFDVDTYPKNAITNLRKMCIEVTENELVNEFGEKIEYFQGVTKISQYDKDSRLIIDNSFKETERSHFIFLLSWYRSKGDKDDLPKSILELINGQFSISE